MRRADKIMTVIWNLIKKAGRKVIRTTPVIGLILCIFIALTQLMLPLAATAATLLDTSSTTQLEARLDAIDAQLLTLAGFNMRSGVGAIGYRSYNLIPDINEWVQVELKAPTQIDQIILVPSLARGPASQAQADAFPVEFNVVVGQAGDSTGTVIAHFTADDQLLPRVAPIVISFPPMEATWIRIEALILSPRAWDNIDSFQLSEVLIFSGQENVAFHQPVKARSSDDYNTSYHRRYLVDGFMPYLMAANQGKQSVAFVSEPNPGVTPTIHIDLETPQTLDQINLHSIEVSNKIPQSLPNDFATPRGIIVEGALKPDFSDAVQLVEYQVHSIYDAGPIMTRHFPATTCRYIRLIVTEPSFNPQNIKVRTKIGFAEVELLSQGKNIAKGRPASSNFKLESQTRSFESLTDGRNFYGDILPLRDWMEQLALRHELQTERPRIETELKQRYARQKTNFNRLLLSFAALLTGTIIMILVDRIIRQRAIHRTREHIAADLHDELGANLHALGLLSDLTRKSKGTPDKLDKLLQRIRGLTERTGAAARYCTDMLEAKELYEHVPDQMRRSSSRILQGFDHKLTFEGEAELHRLSPRKRIDLCLFHKECLTNILRHSGATQVTTHLVANKKKVDLVITDNGQGLGSTPENDVPRSIKRRSRLLGSKIQVETPKEGGTRITLRLNLKRFGIL
jgi:signal transduction histidine kinase